MMIFFMVIYDDLSELKFLRNLPQLKVLWLADNPCAIKKNYREIVRLFESEIDVGKQVVLVGFIVILEYHVMFYVKWFINVYYLGLQNQVGNLFLIYLYMPFSLESKK